jgi:hypothetical protein
MDHSPGVRRTPGIPGLLGRLQWVDSPDYGGRPEDRRGLVVHDVDPAPLARLVAGTLGVIDADPADVARAIAEDERDGPIHIAHLIAACEYGAIRTGGSMGSVASGAAGDPFSDLYRALRSGRRLSAGHLVSCTASLGPAAPQAGQGQVGGPACRRRTSRAVRRRPGCPAW